MAKKPSSTIRVDWKIICYNFNQYKMASYPDAPPTELAFH